MKKNINIQRKQILFLTLFLLSLISINCIIIAIKINARIPDINKKIIVEDFKRSIPTIEQISEFNFKEVKLSDNDIKTLNDTYTEKVQSKKYLIKTNYKTSETEVNGYYEMLYSVINKKYKLVKIFDYKLNDRIYTPIGPITNQNILKDIRKMQIGKFPKGYIGNENNTKIKIVDRKTNLNLKSDDVNIDLTVKNNFAKTTIRVNLKYEYVKNKWILKEKNIENNENYKVEFITENIPKQPDEDSVIRMLTDKNNDKNYITNKSFTKKLYVSKPKTKIEYNNIVYEYIFVSTYEHIGDIEYKVDFPYEYSDGEWIKKPIEASFNKANLKDMVAKWGIGFDKNGKNPKEFICIYKADNNVLEGYYGIDNKKELVKVKLDIDLKDNNWNVLVSPVALEEGLKSIYNIKSLSLDLKEKVINADGRKFIQKDKISSKETNEFLAKEKEKL